METKLIIQDPNSRQGRGPSAASVVGEQLFSIPKVLVAGLKRYTKTHSNSIAKALDGWINSDISKDVTVHARCSSNDLHKDTFKSHIEKIKYSIPTTEFASSLETLITQYQQPIQPLIMDKTKTIIGDYCEYLWNLCGNTGSFALRITEVLHILNRGYVANKPDKPFSLQERSPGLYRKLRRLDTIFKQYSDSNNPYPYIHKTT